MDDCRKRRGSEEQSGRERRRHKRDKRAADRRALVTKAITAVVVVAAAVASALVLIDNSKRRLPIHEPRRLEWKEHIHDLLERKCFKRYYRMPLETFEKLVELLRPALATNAHMGGEDMSSMPAGENYMDLIVMFGVSQSFVFDTMWDVIDAINANPEFGPFYFPQTEEECARAARRWEVRKYLKFVRAKRDIALQSMEGEFNDVNNDRCDVLAKQGKIRLAIVNGLSEDMYSQDDVRGILDGLRGCVVTNLRQEVGAVANMSALLIKQMLEDAEHQEATLAFDTSTVEDQALLEEVERMRVDGQFRTNSGKASRLLSIKDELAQLVEQSQNMQTKNEALEERVVQLHRDCSTLVRERDEDRAEVKALREEPRFCADGKGEISFKAEEGANGLGDADAARREILALKETNEKRINESPQFQQLKRLVASKSQQVVALRRQLARYEPDEDEMKHEDEDGEQKG